MVEGLGRSGAKSFLCPFYQECSECSEQEATTWRFKVFPKILKSQLGQSTSQKQLGKNELGGKKVILGQSSTHLLVATTSEFESDPSPQVFCFLKPLNGRP